MRESADFLEAYHTYKRNALSYNILRDRVNRDSPMDKKVKNQEIKNGF